MAAEPEIVVRAFQEAPTPLLISSDRRIIDCNAAFANMFGYTASELSERSLLIFYPSRADFARIGQRSLHWLVSHNSYEDERFMKHRNGEIFWMKVSGVTLTPSLPFRLMIWNFQHLHEGIRETSDLTAREREIAGHVMNGRTSKETAAILGISHRTVEVHRARLMKKLKARNAAGLISRIVDAQSSQAP